jgi:hypothetical protein
LGSVERKKYSMDKKVTEKRKTGRRTSDDVIKAFSSDLSTILDMLNRELNEIDKEVFLISETSPFLGRRKEDWELQAEVTRKLKEITNELEKVLEKVPGKIH